MRALAIAVVLIPAFAHAEIDEKGVRLGLSTLSVNSDKMMTGPTSGSTASHGPPGPFLGTFITERFAPSFALQFEAVFSLKLSQTEMCSPCHDIEDLALSYLEFPILIRVDLLPGERAKFHLDFGPELAVHLGTQDKLADDASVDLNPINFGGMAGVGFEFGVGRGRMTIDARIKRWLVPLKDGDTMAVKLNPGNQIAFALGYAFP
jgi:hypothetical protein